jgi:hypothetical protein
MSDKFVVLAAYYLSTEAEMARARLRDEGIDAHLTGDITVNALGLQGIAGQMQLHVPEAEAGRAAEILAAVEAARRPAVDGPGDDEPALWVCPLCGDTVPDGVAVCPACQTERAAGVTTAPAFASDAPDIQKHPTDKPDKVTSDAPIAAGALDPDLDLPPLETFLGDDLVRRAFVASLFGFTCALISLYSMWLLARLAVYSGQVSPKAMSKLYVAIALNALACLGWLMLVCGGASYWR